MNQYRQHIIVCIYKTHVLIQKSTCTCTPIKMQFGRRSIIYQSGSEPNRHVNTTTFTRSLSYRVLAAVVRATLRTVASFVHSCVYYASHYLINMTRVYAFDTRTTHIHVRARCARCMRLLRNEVDAIVLVLQHRRRVLRVRTLDVFNFFLKSSQAIIT